MNAKGKMFLRLTFMPAAALWSAVACGPPVQAQYGGYANDRGFPMIQGGLSLSAGILRLTANPSQGPAKYFGQLRTADALNDFANAAAAFPNPIRQLPVGYGGYQPVSVAPPYMQPTLISWPMPYNSPQPFYPAASGFQPQPPTSYPMPAYSFPPAPQMISIGYPIP